MAQLEDAATGARESLQLDPFRRQRRNDVKAVLVAARQLDYAIRGARVLARASVTVTKWPFKVTPDLPAALRHLQRAVEHLGDAIVAELVLDPVASQAARTALDTEAMSAIATSRTILTTRQPLPVVMIIGQLRSITIDLLRSAGNDETEVLNRVDDELGFPRV